MTVLSPRDAFELIELVHEEMGISDRRYGAFTSTHEGLGVLIEEVDELRGAIQSNILADVEHEAIQVAAVAVRLAEACRESIEMDRATGTLDAFHRRSIGMSRR